ncbi:Cytidine deoxycytidylate deaminase [Pseudozyma hubeiensis]|nr:Cytidine deoxycytidylate deaminase [Pseudozyma hubeiensis]
MSCPLHHGHSASHLASTLLTTITTSILPLTTHNVSLGCKVFGAAILSKSTLSLITASTNDEITSPLFHGEISTLLSFHTLNNARAARGEERIDPKSCVFLSTHEPCSLCLSAITWSGFDNFYYLFTYKDTMEEFAIPHDINILREVFQTSKSEGGELYNRRNSFWTCYSIADLIDQSAKTEQEGLLEQQRNV